MAGGDTAIRRAVEGAEDDDKQGWRDLKHNLTEHDTVVGIAASGQTPYVVGALNEARARPSDRHRATLAALLSAHAIIQSWRSLGPIRDGVDPHEGWNSRKLSSTGSRPLR